jgi:hypothetical protein
MNQEFMQARELAELEQFKSYLVKMGLSSVLTPASGGNPVSQLAIQSTGPSSLQAMFIPLAADTFSRVSLLQFFSLLRDGMDPNDPSLLTLINKVNEKTPLGDFLVNGDRELVFKYVLAKSKTEMMDETFFVELLSSLVPAMEAHAGVLLRFAKGETSLSDAMRELD